ncbi:hypothetical protein [Streptomyces sp. NPDC003077]|uniref:hypothetical protein n=1 Tax=Streptomyces sp. NPDC003077 TaxID=3154443 RepID=UPI0033A8E88B
MTGHSGKDSADVPDRLRPEVLAGKERDGDFLDRAASVFFRAVVDDVSDGGQTRTADAPAERARRQRRKSPFFGGWDSLAGQWLRAAQPRSRTGVLTFVAVTGAHLRFVYLQKRRFSGKLGDAVEPGPSFRRGDLVWTRYVSGLGEVQFGFADGSWGALSIHDEDDFAHLFPNTLSEKQPIP